MSDPDIAKASLTPQHLLMEFTSTESLANSVIPSVKFGKVNVGTVKHLQVFRFVYTLVVMEDVYFEGRKLPAMPGIRELVSEWIKPGKQIVSVPNGKVATTLAYNGKKNIFQAAVMQHKVKSVPLPFLDIYGEDPAPERMLYGNPAVPFVQRGEDHPIAAAYYNSASKRFELIQSPDRRTLLENFMRRFGHQTAMAG